MNSKSETLWYKDAVFYELYVRAYCDSNQDGHGDLAGLCQKLDYLKHLGVDCIWLLPIYPSPLKDDGYDIADYCGIHPDYGNLEDFKCVIDAAHERGIRVMTDLVVNHTSDQHPWFQASRSDPASPYRDYYVWSDTDQKYQDARIIFVDTEKSNWTWDETAGQYFWHRFYSCQPDLNFDNPKVQQEMLDIIKFWLDLGVDGFRADAVPYMIEREGTDCENLPETHVLLKDMRRFIDQNYPGRVLLCEANMWPQDVLPYFGEGDEFQMAFHFPVMPRIYMSLRKADRSSLIWAIDQTPQIPDSCQWCVFLRNHDELTLEMVTEEERQWMWEQYAPEARMRINLGIRRRLAPLLDNDRRKLELVNSLLFSLPGSPIIYYGDEIGMGDNIWLFDRNGVRTPMQWDNSLQAGFSTADMENWYAAAVDSPDYNPQLVNVAAQMDDPYSLLNFTRSMITKRKNYKALSRGDFSWAKVDNPAIAAYFRTIGDQRLLLLHNLSEDNQLVDLPLPDACDGILDIFNAKKLAGTGRDRLQLSLQAYQYLWLELLSDES